MRAMAFVGILLLSSWSQVFHFDSMDSPMEAQQISSPIFYSDSPGAVVLPSVEFFTTQDEVEVIVLTTVLSELHEFQRLHDLLPEQAAGHLVATHPETMDGVLQHRTVRLPGYLVAKLPAVHGVIAIHEDPGIPERASFQIEAAPSTVQSIDIHDADIAHSLNITGKGIKVAVVDSGIDFAHPDLNGTQARVDDANSSWDGWPIAYDGLSMSTWLSSGSAFSGSTNSWYADTSSTDNDSDGNNITDVASIDVTNIVSLSGVYHYGLHPDGNLVSRAGGDVRVIVVDDQVSGEYTTVYADLDLDGRFDDEQPMRKGNETSGIDTTGDGLWDRSGGMIYFIGDGNTSVPFAPTYATRNGLADRIPGNGDLVAFMLNEASGAGGGHGTLCASSIAAQGVVNNGAVKGMAPDAKLVAVANYYAGGSSFEAWRFVAEGYDGIPDTGDEASIGSFSFGYSGVVDAGSDVSSLYLDWLTRVYSTNTTYLVALGNGGHGYGTVASPGGSPGVISVGAASSRGSGDARSWGEIASWTDRGPNSQGRMDPDIVAVGWSATGDKTLNEVTDANLATTSWSGTSLATPVAAGLMALVHQAFVEEYGGIPDSQIVRDLVMSTSMDLGYDPNTQGAGWFDAGRAVRTIQGENDTWIVQPAALMAGDNEGIHRSAGINWILPGNSSTHSVNITNPSNSPIVIQASPKTMVPVSHVVHDFNVNTSNGWDGYQSSRPDFAFPVILHGNNSTWGVGNETMLRARAAMSPGGFDGDQNLQSENRPHLRFYRWNDTDGDGIFFDDLNNDTYVADGEWDSGDQFVELTTHSYASPQVEVRVGNPWEIECDGIILVGWMENVRTSIVDPVPIQIDITGFTHDDDPWITLNSNSITLPAHSTEVLNVTVTAPSTAIPGLHMTQIVLNSTNHSWKLPVLTTVAANGAYTWSPPEVDGNVSNQSLYRETWLQGAQRWGWRAESGDWKAVAVDWPAALAHGSMIVDIDWPDNGHTDIDAHILSRTVHPYAGLSPDYPDWGLQVEKSSANKHQGDGIWARETNTGGDREILVTDASEGIKQVLLHSTMHGVLTNDNPVNISVGHITSLSGNDSWVVSNWSQGAINESVIIGSTLDLDVDDVRGYGWSRATHLVNQSVSQDTVGVISSSSYIHTFNASNLTRLEIEIDSNGARDDLDLYVFYDSNSDGTIDWSNEEEGRSGNWNSAEKLVLENPANGKWWVVVHGYAVPTTTTSFWLKIDEVGGADVNLTAWTPLNNSQIQLLYPNGSSRLGGNIPAQAWRVNFTGEMPEDSGMWQGLIEMDLNVGGTIYVPLSYDLQEEPPLVSFVNPPFSSHHPTDVTVNAHAIDIGGGFNASGIVWNTTTNGESTFVGELLNGTLVNITNLTSFNHTLRQVWVSTNLSEDGGRHNFSLSVTDISDRTGVASHWLIHDDELPRFSVSSSVGSLTNSTNATLHILAEEFSATRLFGIQLNTTGNGTDWNATPSIGLPQWFNSSIDIPVDGINTFNLSSTDRSGRVSYLSIDILRDTLPPNLEITHSYIGIHNETVGVFRVNVEDSAQWWLQNQSMNPYDVNSTREHLVDLLQGENFVEVIARDAAGNWAHNSTILHVDSLYPVLNWTAPVNGQLLNYHLVEILWEDPGEKAHIQYSLDSSGWVSLPEMTAALGRWMLEFDEVGEHDLCIRIWDDGGNEVAECRTINLDEGLYTPALYAPWNGSLVNASTLSGTLYVGPNQTWQLSHHEGESSFVDDYGTGVGEELELTFDLVQGMNYFTVIANGRGVSKTFELAVEFDGIAPSITLEPGGEFRSDEVAGTTGLMVRGEVSEIGLGIECIDNLSQTRANTTAEGLSFELGMNPWVGIDEILLDGMKANIICTTTDEAGNYDSAWYNVTLDGIGPFGEVVIFEQLGQIYVNYTIDFQEGSVNYIITIKQDNVTVKTASGDVDSQTDVSVWVEVGASSPGLWTVEVDMLDNVGNHGWVNSTMEIEPLPIFADTFEVSSSFILVAIGLLVIVLMTFMLNKRRGKKNQWQ